MRFWNVQKGTVKISHRPVSEINTANLRDMESFVTQETHLFHDSIKNNLKIAKLDATDSEIEAACRKASVHDFIMSLPQGYDTPVGELGDTLSGGERQRLGLARAFLSGAPLMLLDEPTSNLDSLNEAVILKSLREERDNKTGSACVSSSVYYAHCRYRVFCGAREDEQMAKDFQTKREREKAMVSQMIALYCKKNHKTNGFAQTAPPLMSMRESVAINARSWRRKPSAPTVKYIATNPKCVRKSAMLCVFPVRG